MIFILRGNNYIDHYYYTDNVFTLFSPIYILVDISISESIPSSISIS
jgi:hypothetical protein